jgi:hypothetical protein
MAIPLFGRGRALYALVGKGIAPDVIEEASVFLTGGCQCTVKAQNPGVDLIMNVDWDKLVVPSETIDEDLPPLAGFSGFGRSDDTLLKDGGESVITADQPDEVLLTQATGASVSTEQADQGPMDTVVVEGLNATGTDVGETNAPNSDADNTEAHQPPSRGIVTNALLVLMSLAVIVVLATFYFMPRAN